VCDCLRHPGVPVQSPVQLLILQHPAEQRAWKNSARLLHLAVAGSTLLVGQAWDAAPPGASGAPGLFGLPGSANSDGPAQAAGPAMQAEPSGPPRPTCPAWPTDRPAPLDLLLYPPTPGDAALPAPPALPPLAGLDPAGLRLVLIDATWRKSRRMLYQSPWLQGLPRLALTDPPPSRYHVRRARGAAQRSTFEAAVQALALLDPEPARWDALWPVFDGFVQRLAGLMPEPVQRRANT
jgi:DTW domain-containing protein